MKREDFDMIIMLLKHSASIKSPQVLFDFLMICDPRDPDVLFAVNCLQVRENNLRSLKVADAKMPALDESKFQQLKIYYDHLAKVSDRLQVNREHLGEQVNNILPPELTNIICRFDAPLYRLNNSDTLFRDKKQIDQFRKELDKKHQEFFSREKLPQAFWGFIQKNLLSKP